MKQIKFTDGCPNNCSYCYEPKEITIHCPDIPKDQEVQILDMNFLANPQYKVILTELPKKKWELVCGVDYRRMNQETANIMLITSSQMRWLAKGVPWYL